jgi:hypothetical protein
MQLTNPDPVLFGSKRLSVVNIAVASYLLIEPYGEITILCSMCQRMFRPGLCASWGGAV